MTRMTRKLRLVRFAQSGNWVPNTTLSIVKVPKVTADADGYYAMFGVDCDASDDEIRSVGKSLLMETHPDMGGSEDDFIEAMAAYKTLTDPDLRAEYDRKKKPSRLSVKVGVGGHGGFDIPLATDGRPAIWKDIADILTADEVEETYEWLDILIELSHDLRYNGEIKVGIGGDAFRVIDGIAVLPRRKTGKSEKQKYAIVFLLYTLTKPKEKKV